MDDKNWFSILGMSAMKKYLFTAAAICVCALNLQANPILGGSGNPQPAPSRYDLTVLVSNNPIYKPQILDPLVQNAWGISLRPAGLGGHWWVNNAATGTVTEYVGDVAGTALFQDALAVVEIARSANAPHVVPQPSGTVFSASDRDFMVTHADVGITVPSRFIFCTVDGTISGWGERRNVDGTITRSGKTVLTIDNSLAGASYFGCALSSMASGNRLYAADFGRNKIEVFDANWRSVNVPGGFINSAVGANYYPWNIQLIDGKLLVAYAQSSGTFGEEKAGRGFGKVALFDMDGHLLMNVSDAGLLNAPWGFAKAPANFGLLSGQLLVSNFGDGRITVIDPTTLKASGYLLGRNGKPISIGGIWGITFGNGASLGESNHLYFAAGPGGEVDGIFGKLRLIAPP
jgi:uncharacterized protein (TIGR03118 family)